MPKTKEEIKEYCLENIGRLKSSNGTGNLESDRKDALDSYFARPYGNEVKGRSQVVMSDVADTIEWIMPSLMRIFTGSDSVMEAKPVGKGDEEAAKLMGELVNWQMKTDLNGFLLMHDFIKDSLMLKIGVIKYWWEKKELRKEQKYTDLTQDELDRLVEEKEEVRDIKRSPNSDEVEDLWDATVVEVTKVSRPMAENVPPEEFFFDTSAKNIEDTFVFHRRAVPRGEAAKYDISEDELAYMANELATDTVKDARFSDLGGANFLYPTDKQDVVFVYECFFKDYGKKGEEIPIKATIIGTKIVDMERNSYEKPPFCELSPVRIPHRIVGRSIADLVMDLQEIKTILTRQLLDNIYFQNFGMKVVNPFRINMDDLQNNNRPGGTVRTLIDIDPNQAYVPIKTSPLPAEAYGLLDYVDSVKENRVGVTKYNQGLDSNTLNKTATGISQIMSASQQRIELIARIFAETGIKKFFKAIVDLNLDYLDSTTAIRLNDEWTNVRPQDISGRFDIEVDVGVGTGTKEVNVQQMQSLLNIAPMLMQVGVVTPHNLYNIVKTMVNSMGYKNTDLYATDPGEGGQFGQGIGIPGGAGSPQGPEQPTGGGVFPPQAGSIS